MRIQTRALRIFLVAVYVPLLAVAGLAYLPLPAHREPLIIGHRGDLSSQPENTLAGVAAALLTEADGVEVDVRRAADGTWYLHHDPASDVELRRHDPLSGVLALMAPHPDKILVLDVKERDAASAREVALLAQRPHLWMIVADADQAAAVASVSDATLILREDDAPGYLHLVRSDVGPFGWVWYGLSGPVVAYDPVGSPDDPGRLALARRWGARMYITNDLPGDRRHTQAGSIKTGW